ncbi:hypothetical protein [Xanthomonas phage NEB7]|nr:hypothetical protein [Xanthomonas phage NEB7]
MNPFKERKVQVIVRVQRPDAEGTAQDLKYAFEQHRMSITVSQGGKQFGNAKVVIYGVRLDAMNQIARLWLEALTPQATDMLELNVWDGQAYLPFFSGVITWSTVNASQQPQVALEIEANDAMAGMIATASPYAQEGPVALWDALTAILEPVGFVVDYADTVPDIYITRARVTGTPIEQAGKLMAYFPDLTWHVNLQRFIVRNANEPYDENAIPVARETGMVGYPVYSTSGLSFSTLFDARIRPGVPLDVRTEFDFVNRTKWVASVLQHNLQPNTPGGAWMTNIAANSFGTKGNTDGASA